VVKLQYYLHLNWHENFSIMLDLFYFFTRTTRLRFIYLIVKNNILKR